MCNEAIWYTVCLYGDHADMYIQDIHTPSYTIGLSMPMLYY